MLSGEWICADRRGDGLACEGSNAACAFGGRKDGRTVGEVHVAADIVFRLVGIGDFHNANLNLLPDSGVEHLRNVGVVGIRAADELLAEKGFACCVLLLLADEFLLTAFAVGELKLHRVFADGRVIRLQAQSDKETVGDFLFGKPVREAKFGRLDGGNAGRTFVDVLVLLFLRGGRYCGCGTHGMCVFLLCVLCCICVERFSPPEVGTQKKHSRRRIAKPESPYGTRRPEPTAIQPSRQTS